VLHRCCCIAKIFMKSIHPVSLVVAVIWTCSVLLAYHYSELSATAGKLPERWMGVGMMFGLLSVVLVVVGVWFLPPRLPRLVVRLIQIAGMAGAFWSAGTLTRVIYALSV
jgi:hypothetical protein